MKKVHVVHHTHWDYEWYFTHNESYIQLVYHMDEVIDSLEKDVISYYMLDGQMSILESYLEIFSDKKETIKELVQQGKLIIGPWYTQTDELIIRGESIIRNLDLGTSLAADLGEYFNVGYLPDSFGQGKDMPKIYNGFDMDHSIFWRGVSKLDTEDRDFKWQSEDGSEVVVANIKDGYYVGVHLIYSDEYQDLMEILEDGSLNNHLLLPVGGDQRYVDYNLRERIEEYNENLNGEYVLEESTYDEYLKTIDTDNLDVISGEFISPSVSKIHRSIYSSRYDIKRFNDILERLMIYTIEPLMVMGQKVGIPYKQDLLDKIWKLINLNQAHDSAGGCNSDKTNRNIINRYTEAYQLAYSLRDYLIRKISESVENNDTNDIFLFNTLPYTKNGEVKLSVSTVSETFDIYNQDNEKMEFDLIRTVKENNGSIRKNKEDIDESKNYYVHEIVINPTLPAMSITPFKVVEVDRDAETPLQNEDNNSIENEVYEIKFENGGLALTNKLTNKVIEDFMYIEDSGDDGDTYDYSPPLHDQVIDLTFDSANVETKTGKLFQSMALKGQWVVPYNLESREDSANTVEVPYELTIQLSKDSNRIDFKLLIDNKAIEHRMRVVFDTNINSQYSTADTPFGTIQRKVVDPNLDKWKELGWREEPTAIYPFLNYVNAEDDTSSYTVLAKGIKEYQFIGESFEKIALTLFRSVSYLGKPELIRRPGIASGNEFKYIETPDSQLKEELEFEFAVVLSETFNEVEIGKEYLNYSVEVPYYQIQELNVFTAPIRYFVSNKLNTPTFTFNGLVGLESDTVVYSSIRQSRNNEGYEIRVFNPSLTETVEGGKIKLNNEAQYRFVNLLGRSLTSVRESDTIDLEEFKPGEIKTILITPR